MIEARVGNSLRVASRKIPKDGRYILKSEDLVVKYKNTQREKLTIKNSKTYLGLSLIRTEVLCVLYTSFAK